MNLESSISSRIRNWVFKRSLDEESYYLLPINWFEKLKQVYNDPHENSTNNNSFDSLDDSVITIYPGSSVLKENLVENVDFVLISKEDYSLFKSAYGGDLHCIRNVSEN